MVIDTHIHYPSNQQDKFEDFAQILDICEIDKAIVCGYEILKKAGPSIEHNKILSRVCHEHSDRIAGLGTVHLANGSQAVEEARYCIEELGLIGFKVHPWVQGESVFNENMYGLCELCTEKDVPIMFHDGTPPYAMSSQVGLLAKRFPETAFVLGHAGILFYWEEAIEVVNQNKNIYITLCGPHPLAMQNICEKVDADKITFGTDYLGDGNSDLPRYRKNIVDMLKIDPDLLKKIYSDNVLKLYKNTGW